MNHQATTKGPGSYLFDDDFQDASFNAPQTTTPEQIRKDAHIANGGEAEFKCPACHGSGQFRSYTGRTVGACFKCKGKGQISKGQAAAAKGKATKEANKLAFRDEHADLISSLQKIADWNNMAKSLLDGLETYGSWKDWQIDKARTMLAKIEATREAKKAEREAARPEVNISAIQRLFDTAVENDVKRPIFRTVDLTISKAPMTGKNPGCLYVKSTEDGTYLGKLVGNKWVAAYGTSDVTEALRLVADDPGAEAIRYASKFSRCGICGTATIDPVSVRSAVGPICARKWGLEHLREAASEDLKKEKAEEQAARERGDVI